MAWLLLLNTITVVVSEKEGDLSRQVHRILRRIWCMHFVSELQKTECSSPILTCEISWVRLCKYSLCARHAPSSDFNTCLQQHLPWRHFFILVETQKDKLFEHGMNATGLAVQSSHTGVAICNINTCKIHNVRQPFSNFQPEPAPERLWFSLA